MAIKINQGSFGIPGDDPNQPKDKVISSKKVDGSVFCQELQKANNNQLISDNVFQGALISQGTIEEREKANGEKYMAYTVNNDIMSKETFSDKPDGKITYEDAYTGLNKKTGQIYIDTNKSCYINNTGQVITGQKNLSLTENGGTEQGKFSLTARWNYDAKGGYEAYTDSELTKSDIAKKLKQAEGKEIDFPATE